MVNLSKWQECISDSTMRSFFNLTQSLNFTRSTKVPGGFSIVNHTIWGQTLILDWGTRLRAVVEPLDLCKAVNMGLTVPGLSIPPFPHPVSLSKAPPCRESKQATAISIFGLMVSIHKPPSQAPHGHDLDMLCVPAICSQIRFLPPRCQRELRYCWFFVTLCFFCHHEALCTLSVLTIQFLLRRNFFEEFHRETIVSLPRNVTPAWTQLSVRLASEPFWGAVGEKKWK